MSIHRIRHYGLLASATRKANIARVTPQSRITRSAVVTRHGLSLHQAAATLLRRSTPTRAARS